MAKFTYPVEFYENQLAVLQTIDDQSITEVLVDGSKGSGKSVVETALGYYAGQKYPKLHIGVFRRTLPELRETILRYALESFPKGTYRYKVAERRIMFPNKSQESLNYVEKDQDLGNYAGWNFQLIELDESTGFTEYQICMLKSQLRSVTGFTPKIYYFTNPIGVSHGYHKTRFVDGKEPYVKYETPESLSYRTKNNLPISEARYLIRIPMMTEDNLILMKNNPQYLATLDALPERERKALREGSWDIQAGLFFSQWNKSTHVIPTYVPQANDNLFISCDWGTNKPFAIGWYAIRPDEQVIMYREYYGIKGEIADEGCELTAQQVATKIIEMTPIVESIRYMVLDTSCWSQDGHGISIYELMQNTLQSRGIFLIKANKDRISGWEVVKKYLLSNRDTGRPYLQVTQDCKHFIRTFPFMMYSDSKDRDLDSRAEDHHSDQLRYFLNSRPVPKSIQESSETPYFSAKWFKEQKTGGYR